MIIDLKAFSDEGKINARPLATFLLGGFSHRICTSSVLVNWTLYSKMVELKTKTLVTKLEGWSSKSELWRNFFVSVYLDCPFGGLHGCWTV